MYELTVRMVGGNSTVQDAYNQIKARMTVGNMAGIGTPGERTSYAILQNLDSDTTVEMLYIDEHGILRTGAYALPDPYPVWKAPTGAHDSYPQFRLDGAPTKVLHQGKIWKQNHAGLNSWAPGVFGWVEEND